MGLTLQHGTADAKHPWSIFLVEWRPSLRLSILEHLSGGLHDGDKALVDCDPGASLRGGLHLG